MEISVKTVDALLEEAQFRNSFKVLPKGDTYKDLSTVIVIPIPGDKHEQATMNCPHCQEKVEYTRSTVSGLNPIFVEAFKRLIKPINVPVIDMMIAGCEVGDAYNRAVEAILMNPGLKGFKYMLTLEWDNIVPYIPNTQGPLMMLYEGIAKGYDVVGGLYWTKEIPSMGGTPADKKRRRTYP